MILRGSGALLGALAALALSTLVACAGPAPAPAATSPAASATGPALLPDSTLPLPAGFTLAPLPGNSDEDMRRTFAEIMTAAREYGSGSERVDWSILKRGVRVQGRQVAAVLLVRLAPGTDDAAEAKSSHLVPA